MELKNAISHLNILITEFCCVSGCPEKSVSCTWYETFKETFGSMARQSQFEVVHHEIMFETVELYKDMILGIGAYGKGVQGKM